MSPHWHTLTQETAVKELHSDTDLGLTQAEALHRLAEFGSNALPKRLQSPH